MHDNELKKNMVITIEPGIYIAEAELESNQIQDLADIIGSLLTAAAGHDLDFILRIQADEKTPKDIIEKLNQLLSEVESDFKFKAE